MNDLNKFLYNLLEERRAQNTEQRIVDKRVDDETLEVTLDYRDQSITNYIVLAQDKTIIIRYEDDENNLYQDAIRTDKPLKTTSLNHREDNGYLTISIKHRRGGNHGQTAHSR